MFTGLVETQGAITAIERSADAARFTIKSPGLLGDCRRGDSISVSGVCLTVVEFEAGKDIPDSFTADVMAQTLNVTTLNRAVVGLNVNLERALRVGDRIGGHITQGHVDGIAEVLEIREGDAWRVLRFSLNDSIAALVVRRGSICVDGVSLTVSELGGSLGSAWFEVSLIPETLTVTTLGARKIGDHVNIETDMLARHVLRIKEWETR